MKLTYLLPLLILSGCHTVPPAEPARLDVSLLQPCPERPMLEGKDGKSVVRWGAEMVHLYETCKSGKQALIEAVK